MEEKFIEDMIKKSVESIIYEKVEQEIKEEIKRFEQKLEDRKDQYIAEMMKGIRIYHERDVGSLGINYRIVFENVTRLEKNN